MRAKGALGRPKAAGPRNVKYQETPKTGFSRRQKALTRAAGALGRPKAAGPRNAKYQEEPKTSLKRRIWRHTRATGALGRLKAADTNQQFSRELEVAHTRNRYQSKEEHLGSMLRGLSRGVYGALRAPQARKGGRRPQIRFLGNEKSYTLETGINRKRNISGMF